MDNLKLNILKICGIAFKFILAFLVLLYVGFGVVLFVYQKDFIYLPDNRDFAACPAFGDSEKININGTRAYYRKNSQTLVVFYHGNTGSACDRIYQKDEFEKMGLSYLFVEYAGYSGDPVPASKERLMKDAENIAAFAEKQDFLKVLVMGESLGTTFAVYHSTLAKTDKLLLVAPFYRMTDLASGSYGMYPVSFMVTENYDSGAWMRKTRAENIAIVHGDMDNVIPVAQSRKLFTDIGVPNKKITEVKNANHNDIYDFNETRSAIAEFLGG